MLSKKDFQARIKDFLTLTWLPKISNEQKLLISGLLVLMAGVLYYVAPEWTGTDFCFIAMIFCFIGDVCLNCMPIEKRPHSLLYIGAGAFMIGHIFYAIAYFEMIQSNSYSFFNTGSYIAIGFMILFLIGSSICAIKQGTKPIMLLVFGVYILVIGFNFVTICSYSYMAERVSWIGALAFLGSDFIIGCETVFKLKKDFLRKLVWILYPLGQFLIISSHH